MGLQGVHSPRGGGGGEPQLRAGAVRGGRGPETAVRGTRCRESGGSWGQDRKKGGGARTTVGLECGLTAGHFPKGTES